MPAQNNEKANQTADIQQMEAQINQLRSPSPRGGAECVCVPRTFHFWKALCFAQRRVARGGR